MQHFLSYTLIGMAAICIFAAIHHFISGIKPTDRSQLWFSGVCLSVAGLGVSVHLSYEATSIAEMMQLMRTQIYFVFVLSFFYIWYVTEITGRRQKRWILFVSFMSAAFIAINYLHPHSLQYTEISSLQTLKLPWGESISLPSGEHSTWFYIASLSILSLFGYSLFDFLKSYKQKPDGPFLPLAFCVCILLMASIEGILVRAQVIDFFHVGPLGFLVMVIVMSIVLSRDWRNRVTSSEQRFKSLVQQSPLSIIRISPKGIIKEVNPAFENLWALGNESIVGYDITKDQQLKEKGLIEKMELSLSGSTTEIPIINYNPAKSFKLKTQNSNRLIRTIIYPIVENDFPTKELILIQEDVTEREHLQTQLLQAQKMESLGHFTGGIAHDFNNVLASILGYSEMLLELHTNGSQTLTDKTHKYIEEIYTAGNRAKELVGQMLIFSRLNNNSNQEKAPPILVQPVVKEVVNMLRSTVPKTIDIVSSIEEKDLKLALKPIHLHQLLLNLSLNARDAMGEYGCIEISAKKINTGALCSSCFNEFQGEFVELSIKDSGSGIPKEIIKKIFDPFFTTKPMSKGTGMGLSVVHGIVHDQGGHIVISSEKDKGTLISILLPLSKSGQPTLNEEKALNITELKDALSGLRIMVVDDEESIVNMLQEQLSYYGAEVMAYTNSEEALSFFKQESNNIDVVITDEAMPKLSGLDLSRKILSYKPEQIIILCTGYSEYVDEDIANKTGISTFFYKPIDFNKLVLTIKEKKLSDILPTQIEYN